MVLDDGVSALLQQRLGLGNCPPAAWVRRGVLRVGAAITDLQLPAKKEVNSDYKHSEDRVNPRRVHVGISCRKTIAKPD